MSSNYWITVSDNKYINNSVAWLFQTQIWRFFDAIFPRKSARYLAPRRLIFDPRAFGFVISHERKDSGDENTSGLRKADLFLGGPRLPPEVVSARGPKNLLLHGKNQAGCALYYRFACQNLGVPYPKWMSCKCALIRFEYEYEIERENDFSILVFRLYIITTRTHSIPWTTLFA